MTDKAAEARLKEILELNLPMLYFNTYILHINETDTTIVVCQNNRPVAICNTSHLCMAQLRESIEKCLTEHNKNELSKRN
jgi:hypothetical protein